MWKYEGCTFKLISNAFIGLASLLVLVTLKILVSALFNVAVIEIEPVEGSELKYISPTSIQTAIDKHLVNNLFTVNLDKMSNDFRKIPWIRQVLIHRVWPNKLRVYVEEYEPLALWNKNYAIDTSGNLFITGSKKIKNVAVSTYLVGQKTAKDSIVQHYIELMYWFLPLEIRPERLNLDHRRAWAITLFNGSKLHLGYDLKSNSADLHNVPKTSSFIFRIKRFTYIWPDLEKMLLLPIKIIKVDLRYPNGFALSLSSTTFHFRAPFSFPKKETRL